MADLKIRTYKSGKSEPETTVTIPGGALKFAAGLLPKAAIEAMREKGMDVEEMIRLSTTPGFSGTLLEVDDHKDGERVVISIE